MKALSVILFVSDYIRLFHIPLICIGPYPLILNIVYAQTHTFKCWPLQWIVAPAPLHQLNHL